MIKFASFAFDIRVNALLCCSAAVLLSNSGVATAANVEQNARGVSIAASTFETSETQVVAAALADSATRQEAYAATTTAAAASIYHLYVATTGSDSNPGTQARPFKTINRAAALAKPSTTVHVAPGTYYGNVVTRIHGTATARIRYVSDTKWGAKVIGTGTEFMWTNKGHYTDIVGFDVSGSGRQGIFNEGSNTLVMGNHVHHLKISGGCTGGGGAGINNGDYNGANGDIIGNVVNDIGTPGACIGVQGIYSANLGGKIYNNIVYRASSWGIHLWHAADKVLIANNTVFANGSASMGGGIVIGVGNAPGGKILTNTKVVNNIVVNNRYHGIHYGCDSGQTCIGSGNIIANNLVIGSSAPLTRGAITATGTITADPQFVNYQANGTGDYRLKSSSPAINKGMASYAPTNDIDNISRPRGTTHDLGAYENY
jgi:hypothetical protein